jgi:hypothetical protein
MKTKEEILNELRKVETELIMSGYNDGWWNQYMKKRKIILEKLLNNLDTDDNDNLLNT